MPDTKPEVTQKTACEHDLTEEPLDAIEAHADFDTSEADTGFTAVDENEEDVKE